MNAAVNRTSDVAPRLSIIIATWNAEHTLERCLHSIFSQEFKDWELLIADGASTDGTLGIIRQHSAHVAWWQSRKDEGIYDAWNQALENARGEYVAFLGADDALNVPSTLRDVVEAMGDRTYDLVTGRGLLVNDSGTSCYEFGNPWNYRKVMRRMTICHPGALHRRELFQRFGNFDKRYRITADYDFLLRLPPELRTLHVDWAIARVADGGISRKRRWLMLRERYRAQANCPHVGPARAAFNFIDKLWRIPVGTALGIQN